MSKQAPELSSEAQRLISDARGFDDPGPEDRERVRARWLASIAAGAGLSVLGTAARAGGGMGWGFKAVGVVVALAAGGGALYALLPGGAAPEAQPSPKPEVAPQVAPDVTAVSPEVPSGSPAPPQPAAAEPPAVAAPAPTPPAEARVEEPVRPKAESSARPIAAAPTAPKPAITTPTAPPPSSQLSEELALVGQIRKSIQEGQGTKALEQLAEYHQRFKSPVLAMEAAALRVDALCKAGDQNAARTAAEEFQKTWPSSPLARRVSTACP